MKQNKADDLIVQFLRYHVPAPETAAKIKQNIIGPELFKTYHMTAMIFDRCFRTSYCLSLGK